jgi:hypothetical protein
MLVLCGQTLSAQEPGDGGHPPVAVGVLRVAKHPRVLGIQRIDLVIDDTRPDGERYEKRVPHVEIELLIGDVELNTQLAHIVQIGETQFCVTMMTPSHEGFNYNALVRVSAEEFEALPDGAEISYSIGSFIPREEFRKLYREGKVSASLGTKLGKLDKKMIDLLPTVEKSAGWKPAP